MSLGSPAFGSTKIQKIEPCFPLRRKTLQGRQFLPPSLEALLELADLYATGFDDSALTSMAMMECEAIVRDGGDASWQARLAMAKMYLSNDPTFGGLPKLAERILRACVEAGNTEAMVCLAKILLEGDGPVKQDKTHARGLLERAVEGGYEEAKHYLAMAVLEEDKQRALSLMKNGEKFGDVKSMVKLAEFLEVGSNGVRKDIVRVKSLCEKALKLENTPRGMFTLASILQTDKTSCPRQKEKALWLYLEGLRMQYDQRAVVELASILASRGNEKKRNHVIRSGCWKRRYSSEA